MARARDTVLPILPLGEEIANANVRGAIGELRVVPISQLYVDSVYQRSVSVGSVRVIRRICANFDWAKFLPVIVAVDGDRYHVIDGQHRTIAAATIGIKKVPCYILSCSPAEAAAAFAAINGNVTPMQPIDLWFAELAARDPNAIELQQVLDAAGVKVTRKKEGFAVGETRSINVLRSALRFYGSAILTTILQCIVETGDGNPGMINGACVNGIGRAIRTKPDLLAKPSELFDALDDVSLAEMSREAQIEYARTSNPPQFIITREINALLRRGKESARAA
jgi:hypothetical protein